MAIEYRCCGTGFLVRVGILILLVLFAGLMSVLKSLRLSDVEDFARSGTPDERKRAAKILPVMKKQHLLQCTLSICNAAVMEALPIFLESLVPAWGAILISMTLILMFVEIIPKAVCSRHGLAIGAAVAPVVQLLVWICFPVAYPISKLLDLLLGKEHATVDLQCNEAGKGGELTPGETALDLTDEVPETMPLDDNEFRNGHSHMAVVVRRPNIDQSTSENLPEVKAADGGESHVQNDANPQRGRSEGLKARNGQMGSTQMKNTFQDLLQKQMP